MKEAMKLLVAFSVLLLLSTPPAAAQDVAPRPPAQRAGPTLMKLQDTPFDPAQRAAVVEAFTLWKEAARAVSYPAYSR